MPSTLTPARLTPTRTPTHLQTSPCSPTPPRTRTAAATTLRSAAPPLTATLTLSCSSQRARIGETLGVHPTITTSVFGTKAPTKRNGLSSTRIEQRYPLGQPSR